MAGTCSAAQPLYYAPELPPVVMHAILCQLAGDVRTLCAVACVSPSWQEASVDPRLWAKLDTRDGAASVSRVLTDERLKRLVHRACGTDADGKAQKLVSLDVSRATEVTLRGVLAALHGPRDDAGAPLLRGTRHELNVESVCCTAMDETHAAERLHELRSFLLPTAWPAGLWCTRAAFLLDVHATIKCCTRQLSGVVCNRLASRHADCCEDCGVSLCDRCWSVALREKEAQCEHMCAKCLDYNDDDQGPMVTCPYCVEKSSDTLGRRYCQFCMFFCDLCDARACHDCEFDMQPVFCEGCNVLSCGHCAFDLDQMEMCSECATCYCNVRGCAVQHLEFVSDGEEDGELRKLCPNCRGGNDDDDDDDDAADD